LLHRDRSNNGLEYSDASPRSPGGWQVKTDWLDEPLDNPPVYYDTRPRTFFGFCLIVVGAVVGWTVVIALLIHLEAGK